MATEKHHSIDAQLRQLAPGKVSAELIEYDALLIDRFLDILQDLHGPSLREFVQECYEVSADYEGKRDTSKLGELGAKLTGLAPADAILVASSILHMLNLSNLAEEVELSHRRRNSKLKKGDFADEGTVSTESDIEETLKRLVSLGKTPAEVFEALKAQSVDLVFTAHPTQSARRSLLQKNARIRNCLLQLSNKDITAEDKKELDEALQREIQAAFRTDEIRRAQPTPQDEMRYGMSYIHETVWKGVPKFLRRVDTALKNIGINERLPYNVPLIKFCSWMGGDRDAKPLRQSSGAAIMASGGDRGKRPAGDEPEGSRPGRRRCYGFPVISMQSRLPPRVVTRPGNAAAPEPAPRSSGSPESEHSHHSQPWGPAEPEDDEPLYTHREAVRLRKERDEARVELGVVSKKFGVEQAEWEDQRWQFCDAITALSAENERLKAAATKVADKVNAQGDSAEERLAAVEERINEVALRGVWRGVTLGLGALSVHTGDDFSFSPAGFPGGAPENVEHIEDYLDIYEPHADAIAESTNPQSVINLLFLQE